MAKSYIFDIVEQTSIGPDYSTVIFVEGPVVTAKDLKPAVDEHIADGNYARKPTIIGSSTIKEELNALTRDIQFNGLFAFGRETDTRILVFDQEGTFFEVKNDGLKKFENEEFLNILRRQGITTMVDRNNGIVKTADTFHYVKPSGRHARMFIRTADVFRDSVELSFFAIWLLPFIKGIDVIHCDTAAIFPIVQQALLLRTQLGGESSTVRLRSFGSYSNIKGHDFHGTGTALVVISASTSDGLNNSLSRDFDIKPANIITLIGVGTFDATSQIICDASLHEILNPKGKQIIHSWIEQNCPECKNRSIPIRIQGDSFLPKLPDENKFLIRRSHAPGWLTKTLEFFKDNNVLSGFSLNHSDEPRNITFDLEEAFSNLETKFPDGTTLDEKLQFIIPAAATKIVIGSGKGSNALATTIKKFLEKCRSTMPIDILSIANVRASEKQLGAWDGTLIVAIDISPSSRELLAISRDLRKAKLQIVYIIGMSSFPSAPAYKLCCDDLAQRFDHQKNQVHDLLRIYLSPASEAPYSAWELERKCLSAWLGYPYLSVKTHAFFETRREQLSKCREYVGGLQGDIFWKSPRGVKLTLNPNFSLVTIPTKIDHYNQAEILFAVAATLHHIRFGSTYEPNLFRAVCQRIVLSPRNFDRYNDGILQAALLRLAHPIEIDYRFSLEMSGEIADLVADSANRLEEDASDALPEFLLALAMGRLQLHPSAFKKLISKLEGSGTKGNVEIQDLILILSKMPTEESNSST